MAAQARRAGVGWLAGAAAVPALCRNCLRRTKVSRTVAQASVSNRHGSKTQHRHHTAVVVAEVTRNQTSMTNARPHPGPLSQERENRTQSPERTNDLPDGARFETKDRETATAIATNEILDSHDGFPLSPGERAGVGASVYSNFSPVSFVIAVTVLLCATMRGQTKSADAEPVQAEHSDIGLATPKTSGAVRTLNPEEQWYPDAGLGLFIHCHVRTHAYGHEPRPWLGGILQHLDDRMATHRATLPRARLRAVTARNEPFARRELLARRRTNGHGRIL